MSQPPRPPPRRRPTLASRTALVTIGVAAVAVLVAGAVSLGLVRDAGISDGRQTLAVIANNVAGALSQRPVLNRGLVQSFLRNTNIKYALLSPSGQVAAGQPLATDALSAAEASQVVAGRDLSLMRKVAGTTAFVEARPTPFGGVVLAQRRSEADPFLRTAARRIGIALLVGLGVAAVAGVLLARLLARPLKRAASAAHALASGARDVRLPPEGPAELAELADSLNALAAALQHSEGRQRQFLLSISHELRTPLTAISGFAESLADGVTGGDDVRPVGNTMLGEARRLERLVSDLLDLARLGAQDFRIDLQPVDLTSLAQSAADVWHARSEAVGVRFSADLPTHDLVTVTDATRLRQIIDGLAENALRVTPAGAPIVLGLYPRQGYAAIQVRDGGPGLTPDDRAVAFERSVLYERYRGVRRVGTGVGLALVHGLTTRLGGTAEAGRAPEGGACFTVWLPLVSPAAYLDTVPLSSAPAPLPGAGYPGRVRGG